jgi:hypothetical protein
VLEAGAFELTASRLTLPDISGGDLHVEVIVTGGTSRTHRGEADVAPTVERR